MAHRAKLLRTSSSRWRSSLGDNKVLVEGTKGESGGSFLPSFLGSVYTKKGFLENDKIIIRFGLALTRSRRFH